MNYAPGSIFDKIDKKILKPLSDRSNNNQLINLYQIMLRPTPLI